nr:hypothetical protein GCM10020093_109210 [Planobispora longispora]
MDVLETRWSAAKVTFDKSELDVVGVEFTDGDAAKTKSIVSDYIARHGKIDGVWMDAGATAVAAIEAFEDAGQPVPAIVGEDQQDFLQKWKDGNLTAVAPTYPTYQWRTPIIAALKILKGEEVPKTWKLPQPKITSENLDSYLQPDMPPALRPVRLRGPARLPRRVGRQGELSGAPAVRDSGEGSGDVRDRGQHVGVGLAADG